MCNPALRMIVRAIEDAEKLNYDVEAAVRLVVARRIPSNRLLPLEELYAEMVLELEIERSGGLNAVFPVDEAA